MLIVYFSSATENTKRFVEKVGLPARRIPLRRGDAPVDVTEPYVLVCPTYGGGVSVAAEQDVEWANTHPVPRQVERFLDDEHNRANLRGVIAGGNSNFGADFCKAGDVIAARTGVPFLFRFELLGTEEDVAKVRRGLLDNAVALGLNPLTAADREKLEAAEHARLDEAAQRLARLRRKYAVS
ncbi:class Ib ribonucleoside-diphosphate reductase assembly flavoprotein NrdI [Corynebacterium aquatimens]|uniref:Protein NrdI n=1 Tax=Corynebacterium aquatimens TaxID=1190508 RepID=A0A931GSP1_9CORY|nr:class Ib ribonucleoside-diphosphate reductase assembly flavoprotein NrdI [Corynebacterium aquatimens]MBG6122247.1 protein involved in ribonucleotide reduction [Corynebacterium aquatimens]WJY65212.1 Putative NrdI-like protein [Corynebacterium aquatimens]